MMAFDNVDIILSCCLIQVVLWVSLTYSYKYCYNDVDILLTKVSNLLQLDANAARVDQLEYAIYEQGCLVIKLEKTTYVIKLLLVLDAILLYGVFNSDVNMDLFTTLLIIVTQLCTLYSVVLTVSLNMSLTKVKHVLTNRKNDIEKFKRNSISHRMFGDSNCSDKI